MMAEYNSTKVIVSVILVIAALDVAYISQDMLWGFTHSDSMTTDSIDSTGLIFPMLDAGQQRPRGVIYSGAKANPRESEADQDQIGKELDNDGRYAGPSFESRKISSSRRVKDKIDRAVSPKFIAGQNINGKVFDKVESHNNSELDDEQESVETLLDDVKTRDSSTLDASRDIITGLKKMIHSTGSHELNDSKNTETQLPKTTANMTPSDFGGSQDKFKEVKNKGDEPLERDTDQTREKDNLDNERERRRMPEKETTNEHCKSMKFVVYACLEGDHCGGWGDKQTGIIAAYLLAKVMRRRFIIQDSACGISKLLIPNAYDWTMCQEYISSVPTVRTLTFDFYNNPDEYRSLIDNLDPQKFPLTQVMFIHTNQLWYDLVLSNLGKTEDGEATFGKTVSKLSNWVLGTLFKPAANVQTGINNFRKQHLATKKIICADIYANKPYTELTDVKLNTGIHASAIDAISAFLNIFDNPSKYEVYIASSSTAVLDHYDGMILHHVKTESLFDGMDMDHTKNSKPVCKTLITEIQEQLILSECDFLLLTNSNLGKMAAYVTSRKAQSLFYFIDEGENIVKITKDEIQNYNNFRKVLNQN